MTERNLEQELDEVKAQVLALQQDNAQLAHALKQLSDIVQKKVPHDMFDSHTHTRIDRIVASITRR